MENNKTSSLSVAAGWKSLFKLGAIAAIFIVIIIPIQGIVFAVWPPPKTVTGWFILFQKNKYMGLLDMDLLLIADYMLSLLVYLALSVALWKTNKSSIAIALMLQIVSTATYFASTAAFEMLTLSNKYVVATTNAERSILLASGQSILSVWQGTAFNISYFLGCVATIVISIVMLRSTIFSKLTAYFGLAAGILMIIPPTAGMAGITISFISLLPTIVWLILISRRFFQLCHDISPSNFVA